MERSRIELEMELAKQESLAKERRILLVSMALLVLGLCACVWSERLASDSLMLAGWILALVGIGSMFGCLAASFHEAVLGRGSGKKEE